MHARDPAAQSTAEFNAAFALGLTARLKGEMRGWSLLAIGSLAVAGALALLLALSRTPKAQDVLPWHWESFFYTALVTHVVFSFVVWYLAVLGALSVLATARSSGGAPRLAVLGPLGMWLGVAGAVLLLGPTLLNAGEPSLNNYVPVLIHPAYYAGLGLIGAGVALAVTRLLANPGTLTAPLEFGVAMSGVAFLVAMICFLAAWATLPAGIDIATYNERLFWGGGHVLQFVNTGLMLVLWQVLALQVFGEPAVGRRVYGVAMASLAAFVLPTPLFYVTFDPLGIDHRNAFTDLLWYGLTLPPAVFTLGLAGLLWRRRRALPWGAPAFLGLVLSVVVFSVGGIFGFFLGVSDTRIPSHYHAVIGGVNLAMMAAFFGLLLPLLGRPVKAGRAARWQFWLYGPGQLLWSVGMFLAGAAGVPRKTAGAEQELNTIGKVVSMAMTGSGGIIAVMGGVLFIWLALRRLMAKEEAKHG